MSLAESTSVLLHFLHDRDTAVFSARDVNEQTQIKSARVSDILNVLCTVYVLYREGRRYEWKQCDVRARFAEFLAALTREGLNNSIAEHTKTVCYRILTNAPLEMTRRTYDVLSVLKQLGVIAKDNNWYFTVTPHFRRVETQFTPMCEKDTMEKPEELPELDFLFFDPEV